MGVENWVERLLIRIINRSLNRNGANGTKSVDDSIGWQTNADGSLSPFQFDAKSRLRHLYILGATGSGKTNLVSQLIEADILDGRTTVVLDMRGDLVDLLLRFAASNPDAVSADRIDLIDLRRPTLSAGLNQFQSSADPFSAALHIHAILRSAAESWGVQLDETLRCCLIVLSCTRRSLSDLPRLLTDDSFRRDLLGHVLDDQSKAFFDRFDSLSNDKRTAMTLPVLNKVSPLLTHPSIRQVMGVNKPLDLPALLDQPGRVLLCALAADRLHGLAATFGNLLVSAIENAVMQRVDRPEDSRNPVHLYLDEFEHFASPSFESILAEGRRFKLGLTLSHQNLLQLQTRLRHVILNNAGSRVYFGTGVTDATELATELKNLDIEDPVQVLLKLETGQALVASNRQRVRRVTFRKAAQSPCTFEQEQVLLTALSERYKPSSHLAEARSNAIQHIRKPRAARGDNS